ncbi:MAG: ABC transporter substrate-binding protein [Xanthobacteraceae bacterium]|jgi:branched-chain amino acid transport system substrate-binding protein
MSIFFTRIAAIASLAALLHVSPASAQEQIVIGAALPTTGPFAGSGLQTYQGLQLAEHDINAAGGINGKRIRFQVEDTQASNSVAINAFLKLEQQKLPFIFLSSFTVQNLATEPEVLKAKVPVMYAGGGVAIAERNNPYMFRLRANDRLRAAVASDAVVTILKKKKIGIINVQDQYGSAAAEQTKKDLTAAGVDVVSLQTHGLRDTDFAPQLLNIKNSGADALIAYAYIRDAGLMIKQRRALGLTDIAFVSVSSVNEDSMLELVTLPDLENIIGVADAVLGQANPNGPRSVKFVKDFIERFKVPPDGFGSVYYDGAMIVADGLKKAGADREKLRQYLAGLKDYQGVTGTFSTAPNGDMLHHLSIVEYIPGTKDVRIIKEVYDNR